MRRKPEGFQPGQARTRWDQARCAHAGPDQMGKGSRPDSIFLSISHSGSGIRIATIPIGLIRRCPVWSLAPHVLAPRAEPQSLVPNPIQAVGLARPVPCGSRFCQASRGPATVGRAKRQCPVLRLPFPAPNWVHKNRFPCRGSTCWPWWALLASVRTVPAVVSPAVLYWITALPGVTGGYHPAAHHRFPFRAHG